MIFPCYASSELSGFIKKVRNKSKNSFSGLSIEEIVERVTEHIVEEQKKKKPNPGKDKKTSEAHPAASVSKSSPSPHPWQLLDHQLKPKARKKMMSLHQMEIPVKYAMKYSSQKTCVC